MKLCKDCKHFKGTRTEKPARMMNHYYINCHLWGLLGVEHPWQFNEKPACKSFEEKA